MMNDDNGAIERFAESVGRPDISGMSSSLNSEPRKLRLKRVQNNNDGFTLPSV